MKTFLITVIILTLHVIANTNALSCRNTNGSCLQDFLLIDGICEPCFGSWGINCTQDCTPGYYGFGCRSQCSCLPNQSCDTRVGCIGNHLKDQDKSASRRLCDTLLGISICTASLCLILIVYILCKRLRTPEQKGKEPKLDFIDQDVTLNLHPTSRHMCYLSQNSLPIISNQASSSSGHTLHTLSKSPTRKISNLTKAEIPISVTQDFLSSQYQFSGALSVYNQFYDKCQRNPDVYEHMEIDQTLPNSTVALPSSENDNF